MKVSELRIGNLINNENRVNEINAMAVRMHRVCCWGCSFSGLVYFSEWGDKTYSVDDRMDAKIRLHVQRPEWGQRTLAKTTIRVVTGDGWLYVQQPANRTRSSIAEFIFCPDKKRTNIRIMKARELRVGNLIHHKGLRQIVIGIDVSGDVNIVHTNKESWLDTSEIEPIEVTPALLMEFGFDRETKDGITLLKKSYFTFNTEGDWQKGWWLDNTKYKSLDDALKYLHQLQNLFFSLTGEELI